MYRGSRCLLWGLAFLFSPLPLLLLLILFPPPSSSYGKTQSPADGIETNMVQTTTEKCLLSSECLTGRQFPFLKMFESTPPSPSALFGSLGRWIAAKGGRSEFCRWLGGVLWDKVGRDWLDMPPDEAWHALTWDEGIAEQVEQVLGEDGNVGRSESQLPDLVMQAKTQWHEGGTVRGKPEKRKWIPAAFQGPGMPQNARAATSRVRNTGENKGLSRKNTQTSRLLQSLL